MCCQEVPKEILVVTRSITRTTASLPLLLLLLLLVLVLVLVQLLLLLLLLLLLFFSFQSQPVAQLGVGYVAVHCTGASRAQHYLGKFRYEWLQTCDLLIVQEIVQQGSITRIGVQNWRFLVCELEKQCTSTTARDHFIVHVVWPGLLQR